MNPRAPARASWKRPTRKRVARIRELLRAYYGRPRLEPHHAPLDELVLTVLSQNTNDRNRDIAYTRLRERFPTWADVARAARSEIEAAIKPGGISKVKSERIQAMLRKIEVDAGSLDIGFLESVPRERAIEFLESLPGVGRKTAACVLLFAYGRSEMPVDTHVYRVSSRLGLIRPKASFEEAHDEWLRITGGDADDAYELHVNMLRHGRRICSSQRPQCGVCPLKRVCPYGKEMLAGKRRPGSKRKPSKSTGRGKRR